MRARVPQAMRRSRRPVAEIAARIATLLAVGMTTAAVSCLAGSPLQAREGPDAQAAQQWGLIGTWAIDCRLPAGRSNDHLSYLIEPTGGVRHHRNFGDAQDVNDVQALRLLPDGSIEVTVHFRAFGQTRAWTIAKGRDGRSRTMSNHRVGTDDWSVRDGVLVHSGRPTQWLTRCGPPPRL